MFKFFSFLLMVLFAFHSVDAQKVKRKGTEPLMRGPKPDSTAALYSISQFTGKWQEISRTDRKNKLSEIDDTLYLNFKEGGKVETKEGTKYTMKGAAMIDVDNVLIVASDVYTIKSVSETELLLDDDETYIHKFKKVERFAFEGFGKDSVAKDDFSRAVSVKMNDIMGKWMVYRKKAMPGAISPPTNIITYLKITERRGDDNAKGTIEFFQTPEKSEEMECDIKLNDDNIEVRAGTRYFWRLKTYKADGKEFVFGNPDELLYFAKSMP